MNNEIEELQKKIQYLEKKIEYILQVSKNSIETLENCLEQHSSSGYIPPLKVMIYHKIVNMSVARKIIQLHVKYRIINILLWPIKRGAQRILLNRK